MLLFLTFLWVHTRRCSFVSFIVCNKLHSSTIRHQLQLNKLKICLTIFCPYHSVDHAEVIIKNKMDWIYYSIVFVIYMNWVIFAHAQVTIVKNFEKSQKFYEEIQVLPSLAWTRKCYPIFYFKLSTPIKISSSMKALNMVVGD